MANNNKHTGPNVPALRFPEFSGEWSKDCLNEFLEVQPARNTQGIYSKDDVLSVSGDYGVVNQIQLLGRSFAGKDVSNYHIVRTNEIVYTKSPLKEFPYGIVKTNQGTAGIVSTLYAVYSAKSNTDPKFVEYYFSSKERTNKYFKPIVRIGAKHDMKIGNEEVLRNIVVFPSKQEQNKIQEFLRIIDERIAIQSKIIEEQETLLKSLRESLLKQCSKSSVSCKIGDILTIRNGKDYQHLENGDIPVYGTGGLMCHVNNFLHDGESVCIGRKGTINKPLYLNGKFWPVDTLFYTHSFKGVLPRYCYHLFCTIDWLTYNEASGVPSLSKSTIEKISVVIPPIKIQESTVQALDSVEQKIDIDRNVLLGYQQQKEYLLSRQ